MEHEDLAKGKIPARWRCVMDEYARKPGGEYASRLIETRRVLELEDRLPVHCVGMDHRLDGVGVWTLYNHRLEHAVAVVEGVPFCWVETDLAAMLKEIARHT